MRKKNKITKNNSTCEQATICGAECKIIRSARKTAAIEVNKDAELIFRVPKKTKCSDIENLFMQHKNWIQEKIILQSERKKQNNRTLTPDEEKKLRSMAQSYMPERVKYWSGIMKLKPTGIKITAAKKRFGSCNSKNSICFSLMLMLYPQEAIDYVIVHELAHITHKNHSKNFYDLVKKYYPDYKNAEKLLKQSPRVFP